MIYSLFEFSERRALEEKKPFVRFPYMEDLCDSVERCVMGLLPEGKKHLAISIPPRHYKTSFVSQNLPAWAYGEIAPDCEFIGTSATDGLAVSNSLAVKSCMSSEWYKELYPHVRISKDKSRDKSTQNFFRTTSQGAYYAAGLGGTITGFGAGKVRSGFGGAIIIDDPLKAQDGMDSATMREKCVDYYSGTLLTRRNSVHNTPIILIMQRLHDEDLIGWVSKNESDWHLHSLPARSEDGPEGELLNPHTTTHAMLDNLKLKKPRVYYAQYMQNPHLDGDAMFLDEYWKYYDVPPKLKCKRIYADTAQKDKERNDYTVFQCWGQSYDNQLYLLDQMRAKLQSPDLRKAARAFFDKHRSSYGCVCSAFKIEDKSTGTDLIQTLSREGVPVIGIPREKDKVARANDAAPYVVSGQVHLPKGVPWLSDFLEEFRRFPDGEHDDQVDPLCDAVVELIGASAYKYEDIL